MLSILKKEVQKISILKPKRYILATSFDLSVHQIDEIYEILKSFYLSKDDIIGKLPLNDTLKQYPSIHAQHFKLWFSSSAILDRILNNDVFVQSSMTKESITRRLATYVPSRATAKAKEILDQQHTCIIAGLPGIGKTTLAHILCAEFLANGWDVIHVFGDLREGMRVLNRLFPVKVIR